MKNETTIRRCLRVEDTWVYRSVCFHSTPASSSCMQIAFSTTLGLPSSSATTASR